ncbi:hypothetical protein FHP29_09150 [Nocardioides albidus]|uniref:phospholipase D n=1 Tax=Nocardioides albidus TaxID=1517589 RepID=A0A5C4VZ71_9ACTN|nr:phospholipase D-like domain-containing protein [Nocardioides albidus]TNM41161.1 hypothetical protein FHP29_09150 [Nocardioides albidus]
MKTVAVVLLVLATLLAGLVAPTPPATADDTWQPTTGATFNNPMGGFKARTRVVRQVHAAIRHTPPGATIRIATYNIDRADTARLLVRAHKRGVHVQVIVNDNIVGRTIRGLRDRLGRDRRADSFLHICSSACRNGSRAGNLHLKVYSFSQTGAARSVVISSSSNLGYGAATGQWNDALTISGDDALFAAWTTVFGQLKRDRTAKPRHLEYGGESVGVAFQRRYATSGDPQLQRLRRVDCAAPTGFGDGQGHSIVRVNMYAWYAGRGEALARELASMRAEGCDVAVVGSVVSGPVVRILQRAGIPVRIADWDWGEKLSTAGDEMVFGARCYSHLKYVTVDGTFRGAATRVVWTGSENWSPPGLSSDEVTFEVRDPAVVAAYDAQWRLMYESRRITHRPGIRPTSRPCA